MRGRMQGLVDLWDSGSALVGIAVLLLSVAFLVRQSANGYLLLRRLSAGSVAGSRGNVVRTLVRLALARPRSLVSRELPFLDYVRLRAEHEIFDPRPLWQWPLPEDHPDYGLPETMLDFRGKKPEETEAIRKAARAAMRSRYRTTLREWRRRMDQVLDKPEIALEIAGDLNDQLPVIKRYFDTLKTLAATSRGELKFLSTIRIDTGYVASQHLLSGLLVEFNNQWGTILKGFEEDTADLAGLPPGPDSLHLRQIQSFLYHCWLLWGPSIPVCHQSCHAWHADFATLQFGFGDENNSVEIVGEAGLLREQIDELMKRALVPGAMAMPASVRGELQYSSIAETGVRTIPEALSKSWAGTQNERPILFLSRERHTRFGSDDEGEDYRKTGGIRTETVRRSVTHSHYYSAYLWVTFLMLRREGEQWVPLHPQRDSAKGYRLGSDRPWKSTLVFFEHSNLADPETCRFSKRQLAMKALNGIGQMRELLGAAADSYKFAYVCGIDDPNCSIPLAFPELAGGETVASLVRAACARDENAWAREAIDFALFAPLPPDRGNPHSGCAQPWWIAAHYDALAEAQG